MSRAPRPEPPATDRRASSPPSPPTLAAFEMVGDPDAEACADGVCAIPGAPSADAGDAGGEDAAERVATGA